MSGMRDARPLGPSTYTIVAPALPPWTGTPCQCDFDRSRSGAHPERLAFPMLVTHVFTEPGWLASVVLLMSDDEQAVYIWKQVLFTIESCSQVADAYHNVRNQGLIRALSPSPPWAPKVALPHKRLAILAVPRPRLWQLRQTYAVQVKLWRVKVVSMTRDCITRGVLTHSRLH